MTTLFDKLLGLEPGDFRFLFGFSEVQFCKVCVQSIFILFIEQVVQNIPSLCYVYKVKSKDN